MVQMVVLAVVLAETVQVELAHRVKVLMEEHLLDKMVVVAVVVQPLLVLLVVGQMVEMVVLV
jgi:hypothetical protein